MNKTVHCSFCGEMYVGAQDIIRGWLGMVVEKTHSESNS
jgi:hypothetical protein